MPDLHELLERLARGYEPPLDLYERVLVRSRRRDLKRRVGAGLTAAAIIAAVALGAWSALRTPSRQPASQEDIPTEQMRIIRQVVDAANARDADLLASSFTDDGTFNPYVYWGPHPVRRSGVIPTWMENIEAWGLDAQLRSCKRRTETRVDCDVRTLWHTLQMEMAEKWTFSFEGRRLASQVMIRSDTEPADRSMPLGYLDLNSWERWLAETHPRQARLLLGSDQPFEHDRSFAVPLLRYDPIHAEEIGASIEEYLDSL